jgi:hypothetical protein
VTSEQPHSHGGDGWRVLDAAVVVACLALVGVLVAVLIQHRKATRPAPTEAGPLVDIDALRADIDAQRAAQTPAGSSDATPVAKRTRPVKPRVSPED